MIVFSVNISSDLAYEVRCGIFNMYHYVSIQKDFETLQISDFLD
jgi:hypothetical protein